MNLVFTSFGFPVVLATTLVAGFQQHPRTLSLTNDHPLAKVPAEVGAAQSFQRFEPEKPIDRFATDALHYDHITKRQWTERARPNTPSIVQPTSNSEGSAENEQATSSASREVLNIIGSDNRTQIVQTRQFPWRVQCRVVAFFPGGTVVKGSGTLIGNKHLLTAAHLVHSPRLGFAVRTLIVAGQVGETMPYGPAWVTRTRVYAGWTRSRSIDWDVALLTLDRNMGVTTGTLGYGSLPTNRNRVINLAAYPDETGSGATLLFGTGLITQSSASRVFHTADVSAGQDGGGLYFVLGAGAFVDRVVVAVQTTRGRQSNGGTRLTPAIVADFRRWIATGT
jgi:V8-like Glu-specific endopeptidase